MTSQVFRNDPMFLRNQFKSDGVFEIPQIEKNDISLENVELIGYDKISENEKEKNKTKIVHFFLDDYKFEVMWNNPEPRVEKLRQYKAVLSPNYSVYTEMPLAIKIYNTFKSRWCAAFLQSQGIKVIPTVSWGEPNTYWFCFDGIERGSIVAVSTVGVRTEKTLFMQGYEEMLRKINPKAVICYGKPFEEMKGNIIEVDYAQTNNLSKQFDFQSPVSLGAATYDENTGKYIKRFCGFICSNKGMGSAEDDMPDFPGWDPTKSPGKDFEWRGSGEVGSKKGGWFNPKTRETLHPDLHHQEPFGPHWDYKYPGGWERGYRIFPDNTWIKKLFDGGAIYD